MADLMKGVKRGLVDKSGVDIYEKLKDKKVKTQGAQAKEALKQVDELAAELAEQFQTVVADEENPYVGAMPRVLREPDIPSAELSARATQIAINALTSKIVKASTVSVVFAEDSKGDKMTKLLLDLASDVEPTMSSAPVTVGMGQDWMQTLPRTENFKRQSVSDDSLYIYVGTPGKYLIQCIKSDRGNLEKKFKANQLAVLCRGTCMVPLGAQCEDIYGVEISQVMEALALVLRNKGAIGWSHGAGTKSFYMEKAFGYPAPEAMPKVLVFDEDSEGNMIHFEYLKDYVKFTNQVKMWKPELPVTNWYDTGLLVSVLTSTIAKSGVSMLTDGDGLAMLRDASIGHIVSKLNQYIAVQPWASQQGVYNFFIGDGACRLNGGVELALHLIEGYHANSMITFFVFNNYKWAIEDNLVADTEKEHAIHNKDFYDLLQAHGSVTTVESELELRETLSFLSERTFKYLSGEAEPGLSLVVIRNIEVNLPPVLGDIEPIRRSPEMKFLRETLGVFAQGCQFQVPIYGCSAFEYIQFLHIFMEEFPEGKKYQYVCGRTDIQAAHMCGFNQPEGKCALFINDVYGVNSLGESLRSVLAGFGGKQLLLMIWHPTLMKVVDHFHLHRPPMVWPSMGPTLCKYFVRKQTDACFVEFHGSEHSEAAKKVSYAMNQGTPLIVVNMMPEQERDFISLDVRVKVHKAGEGK